ncbi:isopeptide-forming domain-containing fimbrial protein [Erysipelothrix urinaevulpis]|uniref:isopeptide-forming domain-containing fimbrial protein n=1 Tax=Erysipelothrix urinaevulpis TaxID=2683717 RepID=UPI00135CC88D|nr:isopeptide-forming domain-containing fimbrial protein [Erysipelothrix urinaevulpis]
MKNMKKSFLSALIAFALVTTTLIVNPIKAQGENKIELNNTGIIDNITFHEAIENEDGTLIAGNEKYDYRHGNQFIIKVDFSEKSGYKLTDNHKITLEVPQDLDPFALTGGGAIQLKQNGIHYATVETSANRRNIIITFTNNINNAVDYTGSFNFTVKASYVSQIDGKELPNIDYVNEFKHNMGTEDSNLLKDYSIAYMKTLGSSPFFYKPGGTIWTDDPDHVVWWLHVNRNQDPFPSDLKIVDTIHSGQKFEVLDPALPVSLENLDPDYFFITKAEPDMSDVNLTPQEFVTNGHGTLVFNNDNEFELTVLKEGSLPNYEYTIRYHTKITPEGKYQPKFYNDAMGFYKDYDGSDVVREQLNKEAKNISSGGIIAPDKGVLRVMKLAVNGDDSHPLGDVTFKIFNEDGSKVDYLTNDEFVTKADGTVDMLALQDGKYYITELSAPGFVTFDPTEKYPFELKENSQTGVLLVISNNIAKKDVNVEKIWNDSLSTHPDITIDLLADGMIVDSVTLTDGVTNHTFSNLPTHKVDGTKINYTVKEHNVAGYTSVVDANGDYNFTINNYMNGKLEALKEVSAEKVKPGEEFTYTITVKNTVEGSAKLENIKVEDTLPEGINFTDGKILVDGVESSATVTDNKFELILASVEYGSDIKVSFKVKADEGIHGERVNIATVTNPEDPENPEEPDVPVVVVPDGNLEALKEVSADKVKPGEEFSYTITVKNTVEGSDALKNIKVEDTLPEGINFTDSKILVDGVESSATVTDNKFELILASVEYGSDIKVSFKVKADEGTHGERINIATITNPEDPENPEEPEVPVVITPNGVIEAIKEVSSPIVKPNETFMYTIIVKNITEGSESIKNVNIKDTLPNGIEFTDGKIYINGVLSNFEVSNKSIDLDIDEVVYGQDVKISFNVKATENKHSIKINKALVTNPEDPENPIEPEVPVVVVPDGNLEALKEVSADKVKPGEEFTYTITVKNTVEGSDALKNIKVEDTLPEGINFTDGKILVDGVESNATVTGNKFELILSEVSYGTAIKVSFKVKADEGIHGERVNIATVTNPEDPENPEEPEVPVVVVPDGNLEALKEVSADKVKPGEEFTYTITVKNTAEGSDALKNIKVEDTLPEGINFTDGKILVDGVESSATVTDNKFELILASVEYGTDIKVSFKVKADEGIHGERINIATVTNPEDPENPEEPEIPVVVVPDGKFSALKEVSANKVKPGEEFTYTITVKNTVEGSDALKNIKVEDTLPAGINFTDGKILVDGVESNATVTDNKFELILSEVSYGSDIKVSFKVKADEGIHGERVNIATVTNPEDPENPEEPEIPVVVVPDGNLEALKEVSDDKVKPGEEFTYTITVKNTVEGSDALKNIKVEDTLPEGINFTDGKVLVNGVESNATVTDNKFELILSEVSYGSDIKVSFKVKADEGIHGERLNIATVTNPEDPENPEEPEVPVVVVPDGNLEALKEVSADKVKPGEEFTYTITVKNTVEGSDALKNIKVEDTLPEGINFIDGKILVDGVESNATVTGNKFELILSKVSYGSDIKVSFKVKADEKIHGERLNIATVTNPEDPENPEEPEIPVVVVPDGNLEALKEVSADKVKPGEEFTYTITVKNTVEGSDALKNIKVEDTLPEGINFIDGKILVDGVESNATVTGNKFELILSEVSYGSDIKVSFKVKADEGIHGERVNIATVTNPEDPENPEEPEVPVVVVPDGNLEALKEVSADKVKPGEEFTYTITVKNTVEGSDALKNIKVEDTLPEGINFTDGKILVNGVESNATVTDNKFELILASVEYGTDIKVSFKVKADEGIHGERVNIATVTNPEDPENPIEPEVPVEIVPDKPIEPVDPKEPVVEPQLPNTGMSNMPILFALLTTLSGAAMIVLNEINRKKEQY